VKQQKKSTQEVKREERAAVAMRENLRKRKAQMAARGESEDRKQRTEDGK